MTTLCSCTKGQDKDIIVIFAAASLNNAMTEIANLYQAKHSVKIQQSFASSAALAKQIKRGAPADIYISADQQWMDYLQTHRLIQSNSRKTLLANKLVLISPVLNPFEVEMLIDYPFSQQFSGKLCIGQMDSVPAGIYAKQALTHYNWLRHIKSRLVGVQNVRSALVYVERGECQAGIVYETDAMVSDKVKVIGQFPTDSHRPIRYPMSLVKNANPRAKNFMVFLKSEQAKAIFKQYGFIPLP